MNKKTLYTILIIIFIVVILFFCLRYYYKEKETNINLSNNNSKESIKENTINENNTTKEEKEIISKKEENNSDNKIPEETIIKDENIAVSKDKITIIDESKDTACASAIEYYYEDNNYKYYFTCIKSGSIFVIVDGKKYNIKEALNNKVVTMAELESNGFKPLKEEKNLQKY